MSDAHKSPVAVLISDLHFTPNTLEVASAALIQAQNKSVSLGVPLILCGDTLDSKAIMRAECVNRLIEILSKKHGHLRTYILVGNHDLLNEKGKEHSLEFLKPYVNVVDGHTIFYGSISSELSPDIKTKNRTYLLPYFSDPEILSATLNNLSLRNYDGATLIIHQGVQSAFMGHYTQDKTSLPKEAFADFRVISGHYHRAQDIKCGRPRAGAVGLFSYVGTAYTTSFAEANDGPKGFQVLHNNGLLEFVPTNLRKHMIVERSVNDLLRPLEGFRSDDILWLKVSGPSSELFKLKKKDIARTLVGHENFKFDLIPNDNNSLAEIQPENKNNSTLLDEIIDTGSDTEAHKSYLKTLWREVMDGNS